MEYEFESIENVLAFIKPLLVEGNKKVAIKTIFEDTCVKRIDYYSVTVEDNEFKYEE